jgi:hypothetical protein
MRSTCWLLLTACCALWFGVTGPAADDKADDWGTVKGQLVFEGDKLPEPEELKVQKDENHCLAKGKLYSENWVINKDNKGVRNALIWLVPDPESGKKQLPIHKNLQDIKDKEVTIDQPCCMFVPHVIGLRQGQDLVAKNSAPIVHNIRWNGNALRNPGGSVIIPANNQHAIKDLKEQKLPVTLACDVHPWMKGYVGVFNHPYFAVTDASGNFEIKLAPAGKCRLMVWQEAVGYRNGQKGADGEPITIKGGTTTDLGKLGIK